MNEENLITHLVRDSVDDWFLTWLGGGILLLFILLFTLVVVALVIEPIAGAIAISAFVLPYVTMRVLQWRFA